MRTVEPIRLGHVRVPLQARLDAMALLADGRTTEGEEAARFQKELARAMGYRRAVACSSGTAALWLIFSRLRVLAPDFEVVTSPLTYAATANAPESLGFRVAYSEVNPQNYGLAGGCLRELKGGPRLVETVHLLGYPSNVLGDVADACEAVGADLPKPKIAMAVSFYPSHTVGVGELGAVLTDDDRFADQVAIAKDNGRDRFSKDPFQRLMLGLNFRASEVTCLLARDQLRKTDRIVDRRRQAARLYTDLLGDHVPKAGPFDHAGSYLGYPLVFLDQAQRRRVMRRLDNELIEYRKMFPLLCNQVHAFPMAKWISDCGLYLPCHQHLSEDDVQRVAHAVRLAA